MLVSGYLQGPPGPPGPLGPVGQPGPAVSRNSFLLQVHAFDDGCSFYFTDLIKVLLKWKCSYVMNIQDYSRF